MQYFTIYDLQKALQKQGAKKIVSKFFKDIKLAKNCENYFISFTPKIAKLNLENNNHGLLSNILYSLKDNICVDGTCTTGGSKILEKFYPDYDANVYTRLANAGAILIGKNNLDELGMGGTGQTSHFGKVKNPWNAKRITGGSSSGSAASVAKGIIPFSIGSDTGDSVRSPAAYCGIYGFKPTWNRISKFGVIPYTPSLDTLGILANCTEDIARVYEVISGPDKNDATSTQFPVDKVFTENRYMLNIGNKKALLITEIDDALKKFPEEYQAFHRTISHLKSVGVEIQKAPFGLDLLKSLFPTYNVLSYSESTSCQSYLQGIAFGNRVGNEPWHKMIYETRKQFTSTTKLRQILGAFFLSESNRDKYFEQSKKVRKIICYKLKNLFKEYDVIITPAASIAPLIKDSKSLLSFNSFNLLSDHFLLANFYGSPSIALPIDIISKMPYGIVLTTDQFKEDICLSFAFAIEKFANWETKREKLLSYVQK